MYCIFVSLRSIILERFNISMQWIYSHTFNAIEKRIKTVRNAKEVVNKMRDKNLYIEVEQKSREESL